MIKKLKTIFFSLDALALVFMTFYTMLAFAQDVVAPADFFAQVLDFIKAWGGLATFAKVSGVILLVVAFLKTSFMAPLWEKMGPFKAWLAPILGLVAGVLGLFSGGQPVSLASVFSWLAAGAGAVILHELLDTVKAIPGIGPIWVTIIDVIESALKKPAALRK